jgi:methionyl-tRNA formyltransferase
MSRKSKIKNVIFLARKMGSIDALKFLLQNKITVKAIVTHPADPAINYLLAIAKKYHILFFTDDAPIYNLIEKKDPHLLDIDLVISYLFWRKIRLPLINLPKLGCLNFHPAPLPDYKSRAGYNTAILEKRKTFGVSAHFINSEEFDSGRIIKVLKFKIDPKNETVISLEKKTQNKLLELFKLVIELFLTDKKIKTKSNVGGLYLTAKQLDALKKINISQDSLDDINTKIRAFFFPPHLGAYIEIKGQKFNLINEETMSLVSILINKL